MDSGYSQDVFPVFGSPVFSRFKLVPAERRRISRSCIDCEEHKSNSIPASLMVDQATGDFHIFLSPPVPMKSTIEKKRVAPFVEKGRFSRVYVVIYVHCFIASALTLSLHNAPSARNRKRRFMTHAMLCSISEMSSVRFCTRHFCLLR